MEREPAVGDRHALRCLEAGSGVGPEGVGLCLAAAAGVGPPLPAAVLQIHWCLR